MMPRSDWEAAGCCEEDAAGWSDEELFVAIAGKPGDMWRRESLTAVAQKMRGKTPVSGWMRVGLARRQMAWQER